jgi:hypothetical protein
MTRQPNRRSRSVLAILLGGALTVALVAAGWVAVVNVSGGTATLKPGASRIAGATSGPSLDPETAGPSGSPYAWDLSSPAQTPLYGWTPSPSPPPKGPFRMDMYTPGTFISQMDKHSCTAGATQNMLNLIGPTVDLSTDYQKQIATLLVLYTTTTDSHNGGFGPQGWATTMTKMSGFKYELLIEPSLDAAMHEAALALRATNHPVGLLAWRGAHSWVMTGFRSTADPRYYPDDFTVQGAYIVDAFYPRYSTRWGQTLGPDTYRDMNAMAKNFLPWKRPEGRYPGRDGKWLLIVPRQ